VDNNRHSSSKKNITILWIEDQPDICDLGTITLRSYLGAAVEVDRASVAEVALDKLGKNHYDLIITDLVLPGLDGLQLISHVRQRGIEGPIIVASAKGEPIDQARAFEAGADAYVVMPLRIEEFVGTVEEVLRHGRMPPDPRQTPMRAVRARTTPKSESADGGQDWLRQWDQRIEARFLDKMVRIGD
jgi:DNA-binding response OmpR family regulator